MVIDADAIKALAEHRDALRGKKAVITPHAREFQVFAGMEATEENVVKIASDLGITVLLKGHIDLITDGTRVKINRTGCAAMTVGGTGDVLSGIVGALLSKGMEPFDAARLGAYISGLAGEKAYGKKSYGMCASDVVENIGEVLKEHLSLQ
jgi:NAD(P)H-hydrate epimerase